MPKIKKITSKVAAVFRITAGVAGIIFLLVIIFAMTSLPFWARYRLARSEASVPQNTQSILIMGGGGFPSESVLMRLWYAIDLAVKFPKAKVIVATPGNFADSTSTIFQMYHYLETNGVDPARLLVETHGLNTRHQALMAYRMYCEQQFKQPLVIVSSPSHIYRSVRSFKKAGFTNVSGRPTEEMMLETDLRLPDDELGGNTLVPDASCSISLRYKFWDYLKYEVEVMREYIAIAYYKLKGWI